VGRVARCLIQRKPTWLKEALFPQGSELIAAAHDIGKASPTFQMKIYRSLTAKDEAIFSMLDNEIARNFEKEQLWGGHAGVSQASASIENSGRYTPEILGQHHGFSPNLSLYSANSPVFGGSLWHAHRRDLLNQLKRVFDIDFPVIHTPLQAKVLAGLTTVADWIGSGARFEDPAGNGELQIEQALDEAGFIAPNVVPGLKFSDVFTFEPKETQVKLIEAASQPGVYVLEAPMGMGKTEAALYSAYQLVEKNLATGIYFALPTQLTSDKIHERMNHFLSQILDEKSAHKNALLVHSNAGLTQVMGEEGGPGGAWFAQGKRGILAPFAVGTIDQALMAVMNVKHGFVRTFGLAGKVVILDEVHSYDSFTGTILDALIKALRELHCTVIILSATLTQERREKLLGLDVDKTGKDMPYPLITSQPNQGLLAEISVGEVPDVTVMIGHENQAKGIEEALLRASQGQQVLWIENTVGEAQKMYQTLAARTQGNGIACGLLHSRFTKEGRTAHEAVWVTAFGKGGISERHQQGRILVGTQVLEQSLDIDADFLITRIAPTDMLLQRLGRLWRHNNCRPRQARREAWIIAPELEAAIATPAEAFGASAMVYAPYVLCRSLEVWRKIDQVKLPSQIRTLIEATYQKKTESEQMNKHLNELTKQRDKLSRLALLGLSTAGNTQPEEAAKTRYSEQETTDVLLIRDVELDQKGAWVTLINRQKIWLPRNGRSLSPTKLRELTVILMQNTLKTTEYLAPLPISREQIAWLGSYFYLGRPDFAESNPLRVALVDEAGSIRSLLPGPVNETYTLRYDEQKGYQSKKMKRS
jgi:CRISPR-associated endonuclease/helicase Cas3